MRFSYPSGQPLGILVQPIKPPTLAIPHSIVISPHVVVYISDTTKPFPPPRQQVIARLFNLSIRESHLTTLLSDGYSLAEAAKAMNITQTTARSYLKHIYEKVGVNRREALLQRVMKNVVLLG